MERWSEEDINYLKNNYWDSSKEELLNYFPDKKWKNICSYANRLGLKRKKDIALINRNTSWSKEDRDYITEAYGSISKENILKYLPHKSWNTIKAFCKRVKIKRPDYLINADFYEKYPKNIWTELEDSLLKILYKETPREKIIERIPSRTWKSIRERANKLGLSREKSLVSKETQERSKKSLEDKYGVNSIFKDPSFQKKIQHSFKEKYGADYPSQVTELMHKKYKNNLEKYGVEHTSQVPSVKDKIRQTNLSNYGMENYTQTEECQVKVKETNMERHGVENVFQNENIKNKIKQTNLDRYGASNFTKTSEYVEKSRKTCLDNYGSFPASKSELVQEKIKNTNLAKYGSKSALANYGVKEKIKKTNIERYGVPNPAVLQEVKDRAMKTNLERYGVPWTQQNKYIRDKDRHIIYDKDHCWQYDIKLANMESDLKDIGLPLPYLQSLPISCFEFRYVSNEDVKECFKIKKFIEKYEWLGKMPLRPTHRFVAYYKDTLAGVIVMATPNAFSKILGKETINIEKLISRGACISWSPKNLPSSLIMWSIRWMVKNTPFRLFTAYSDPEAKELGTIYQACNFFYLGKKYGADKLYFDPLKPQTGWFSNRVFKKINKIKSLAKRYSIYWEKSWQSGYAVLWGNMDEYTREFLKDKIQEWMNRCEVRDVPDKHKYCYILGKNKKETFKLRKIFFTLGNKNIAYPTYR